jgi:predicted enzyme related to lactoylglutathione lyase
MGFARIKHMAITSDNCALLGRFYQALFGMTSFAGAAADSAAAVSDGYVGLNLNPRAPGRQAGFDHFGFEIDDVDTVQRRLREAYPTVNLLKRPSNRPFAGLSTHDPAGNVFDLSQRGMENRGDVYAAETDARPAGARISHFVLRVMDPPGIARFYQDVFELQPQDRDSADANWYLTDGKVTLVIAPWNIMDYAGSGIERPALDHLGFAVPDLGRFREELEAMVRRNPALAPGWLGVGPESEVRLGLLRKCKRGQYQLADPDGVLIDVGEAA